MSDTTWLDGTVDCSSLAKGNGNGKPNKAAIKGRFAAVNAFVDTTIRELNRTELCVWFVLWRYTDAATGLAKVSLTTMGTRAGCTRRQAIRAVKKLKQRGLIDVVTKGSNLTGCPSTYRISPTVKDG